MINHECVNKDSIRDMMDMIPGDLNGLERAVICSDGTVQTMLSAIFYAPVKVEVVRQTMYDTEILRTVELVAVHSNNHEKAVCKASSTIQKKGLPPGFSTGIRECNMGIGQLISSIGINTKRKILSMESNEEYFKRHYEIREIPQYPYSAYKSDVLNISIIETFPRELYAIGCTGSMRCHNQRLQKKLVCQQCLFVI